MKQLLGMTLYFKTHIPNYFILTADLHEMVRKDFYGIETNGPSLKPSRYSMVLSVVSHIDA
jgi:hypothetical protein